MKQIFNGVVKHQDIAPGSKSEHDGPVLDTGSATYPLRMVGANPFEGKAFDAFINQRVSVTGVLQKNSLIVARPADISIQP